MTALLWTQLAEIPIENSEWLSNLGYVALALLTAVEGPLVTILGGVAASAGHLRWEFVILAAALGNFIADASWYGLGYLGGFDTLLNYVPRLRQYQPQINALQGEMHDHALKLLLLSKFTLGVASIPTLVAAGMVRVSWQRLAPLSFAAELVWTSLLVGLGYFLGDYLTQLEQGLQYVALVGFMVLALVVLWLYRRIFSKL